MTVTQKPIAQETQAEYTEIATSATRICTIIYGFLQCIKFVHRKRFMEILKLHIVTLLLAQKLSEEKLLAGNYDSASPKIHNYLNIISSNLAGVH